MTPARFEREDKRPRIFTTSFGSVYPLVLFRANSLEEAAEWAPRYGVAVDCHELDLRQVADEL
ncbi:MAG: hypothetical protein AB2A00_20725 [Myxococcota bacterium]